MLKREEEEEEKRVVFEVSLGRRRRIAPFPNDDAKALPVAKNKKREERGNGKRIKNCTLQREITTLVDGNRVSGTMGRYSLQSDFH